MLRLAFDFIITWRETRTRPNAYATKEPKLISEDYKEAICRYEEKTLEELSKERK